jgi:hypothetical protein
MPQTKATDRISETARVVMARGFALGWSAKRIAEAVAESTGEQLAPRTVSRRAAEWRAEMDRRKAARERMSDLVAAMKAGDMDASETIQALAMDELMDHPEALTGSDPIKVQSLSLAAEELRLKKRQLDIRERSVVVTEKKLQILEGREQRAIAALQDGKDEMTPEERMQKIREIYGLSN